MVDEILIPLVEAYILSIRMNSHKILQDLYLSIGSCNILLNYILYDHTEELNKKNI